jgi:Type II CAAX prenyl endopeptidase Rce1-like
MTTPECERLEGGRSFDLRVSESIPSLVRRWEANTISDRPRLELVSALVIAPLLEEAIFRLAIFRLAGALHIGGGPAATGSAALFGLTHLRFGRAFVGYAGVGGLVLWATYVRTGYWGAVLLHLGANLVDLSLGWRRYLYTLAESGGTARTPL